jgi:carboxylesterase
MPSFDILPESGEYHYERSPRDAKAAVLCIHGYIATPYEVKPAADALSKLDYHVIAPVLPLHGISSRKEAVVAFRNVSYKAWIDFIVEKAKALKARYGKLYVYGQSMGGLLALYLGELGIVDKIAVTGAAIYLPRGVGFITSLLGKFPIILKIKYPGEDGNPYYDFVSSRGGRQLFLVSKMVRNDLHKITCPLLIVHSHNDIAVPYKAALLMKEKIPSAILKWFDDSGHTYLLDKKSAEIVNEIVEFFEK